MAIKKIVSRSNPLIKELISIKNLKIKNHFILEGLSLINTALEVDEVVCKTLLFTKSFYDKNRALLSSIRFKGCSQVETSEDIIAIISDTASPQGIAAVVSYSDLSLERLVLKDLPLLVLCDGVNDPGNLGALIRSSAAFYADAVILLPGTCNAFSSKTIRASAGGIFHLPLVHCGHHDIIGFLRSKGIALVAAEASAARDLKDMDLKRPIAFAFGNEGHGLSTILKDAADCSVSIMMSPKMESLNVAVASSIFLYEAFMQRIALGLG